MPRMQDGVCGVCVVCPARQSFHSVSLILEQLHLLDFTFIIYSFISTGWLDLWLAGQASKHRQGPSLATNPGPKGQNSVHQYSLKSKPF